MPVKTLDIEELGAESNNKYEMIVVIGGLISGTLITLLAIPLLARFVHARDAGAAAS
jgi:Cu/Ag efflux pump CusA